MKKLLEEQIDRQYELLYDKKQLQESDFLKRLAKIKDNLLRKLHGISQTQSGRFTQLNLNTPKGFNAYTQICQIFINKRNPNAGITGIMLANSAKNTLNATKKYIPPELALAQLTIEGGLSKNIGAKPIRTNNPYNVGNWDSGKVVQHDTRQSGINKYYSTIANDYLTQGKTPEDLTKNFVNVRGERYASNVNYENLINEIINDVNKIARSVLNGI